MQTVIVSSNVNKAFRSGKFLSKFNVFNWNTATLFTSPSRNAICQCRCQAPSNISDLPFILIIGLLLSRASITVTSAALEAKRVSLTNQQFEILLNSSMMTTRTTSDFQRICWIIKIEELLKCLSILLICLNCFLPDAFGMHKYLVRKLYHLPQHCRFSSFTAVLAKLYSKCFNRLIHDHYNHRAT